MLRSARSRGDSTRSEQKGPQAERVIRVCCCKRAYVVLGRRATKTTKPDLSTSSRQGQGSGRLYAPYSTAPRYDSCRTSGNNGPTPRRRCCCGSGGDVEIAAQRAASSIWLTVLRLCQNRSAGAGVVGFHWPVMVSRAGDGVIVDVQEPV